uniref:hypothetical protein n=1 Tax=Streptomyces sp. NBC_01177 TaxID=2903761 RepID=UPI002F90A2B3|nr:hypothetical protein OG284_36940 [Streptomyces sp. NBC_01177]
MWFDQEAVRMRAGRKPDRGNPSGGVLDWSPGAVDRLDLPPLNVQPRVQDESTDTGRNAVITGWRVQSDEGVDLDVRARDRIEWGGELFEVEGEIARWPDPIEGGVHHTEFNIKRVTG